MPEVKEHEMNYERLFRAVQFAAKAHEGQKRKGKNPAPYIAHPILVGMGLLSLGYKEEVIIAGILHDLLEDTATSRELIKEEYGEEVFNLIEAVTEPKDISMAREEKKRTWEARKQAKLNKLKSALPHARAIAGVDLFINLIELKNILEEEGKEASQYFNIDISKKINHAIEELELYTKDNEYPHSKLVPKIQDILGEIKGLLEEWERE